MVVKCVKVVMILAAEMSVSESATPRNDGVGPAVFAFAPAYRDVRNI